MSGDWMNGVYPDMRNNEFFGTRKRFLETRLEEASGYYSKIFPELQSPDRLAEYLEKRNPRIRELFLDTALFVHILYDELASIPDYLKDAVAIVMMFSIIETLQTGMKKYVTLSDWLQGQECARKLDELVSKEPDTGQRLKALRETYFSKYGSTQAALDFFENNLSDADKKTIVRAYGVLKVCLVDAYSGRLKTTLPGYEKMTVEEIRRLLGDRVKTDQRYLPVCYAPDCYVHYHTCSPDESCHLNSDENVLRQSLNKVIKGLLYAYRNGFVHSSNLPTIPADTKSSETHTSRMIFDFLDDRQIVHELDLDFLLKAFGPSLKHFFDTATMA